MADRRKRQDWSVDDEGRNIFAERSGVARVAGEAAQVAADPDLERYLIELQKCMRCGQCRTNCPVFRNFGSETDVARGKLALLAHALAPEVKVDRELYARLTRCVNCGRCRLECPSGTDTGYAMLEGRLRLMQKVGLPAVKAVAVRGLFGSQTRLRAAAAVLRLVQPLFFRPREADPRHVRSLWRLPILGQRVLLPRLRGVAKPGVVEPRAPQSAGATGVPTRAAAGTVVVYPGCLVDIGYPELLDALVKVYTRLGYRVVVPKGLVCCGAPAAYAGDMETARRLAVANLKALLPHLQGAGSPKLAFLCPSCAVAFNHDYPQYLFSLMSGSQAALAESGLSAGDLALVAERTVDAAVLAWEYGAAEFMAPGKAPSVTYHDPCHLRRLMGVVDEPRAVLRHLAGGGFVDAPNPDSCCGFGGTFAMEHAAASSTILENRSRELASTGTEVVATACPGCMAWLANGLDRVGSAQRPAHLIELMAEAMAAEGPADSRAEAPAETPARTGQDV